MTVWILVQKPGRFNGIKTLSPKGSTASESRWAVVMLGSHKDQWSVGDKII